MAVLEKELRYFQEHQDELVEEYYGRFIVIKNQEVIGDYSSELEAYEDTKEEHESGTFLIQHCMPGEDVYTTAYHSRVKFR
jgi:hypothetical protein